MLLKLRPWQSLASSISNVASRVQNCFVPGGSLAVGVCFLTWIVWDRLESEERTPRDDPFSEPALEAARARQAAAGQAGGPPSSYP